MVRRNLLSLCLGCLLAIIPCYGAYQSHQAWLIEKQEITETRIKEDRAYEAERLAALRDNDAFTVGSAEADTEDDIVIYEMTEEEIAEEEYWDELSLLAELVEAEAGNQDLKGKQLVVDVVLNRVDSELFPDTITEVIFEDHQFSTVLDGALDRAGWQMQDSDYEAVLLELDERLDYDIVFFTAGQYNPSSCAVPAYKYGYHYFSTYRE